MRALSLFLAITMSLPTFAAETQESNDINWMEATCRSQGKRACLIAYGWHWLRKGNVVIDPALETIAASGGLYTLGILARAAVGETEGVQYVLTVARAGLKAGGIVLLSGVVFTVVATFASAATFLLQSTSSTAGRLEDEPLYCDEARRFLKEHNGLGDVAKLSPEQMRKILPCLPKESELSTALQNLGLQAMNMDRAGNSTALK